MATSQISILLIIIIDRLLICEIGEIRQHNAVAIVCDTVLPGLSIHHAVDSVVRRLTGALLDFRVPN
jgi:hypothetical protein